MVHSVLAGLHFTASKSYLIRSKSENWLKRCILCWLIGPRGSGSLSANEHLGIYAFVRCLFFSGKLQFIRRPFHLWKQLHFLQHQHLMQIGSNWSKQDCSIILFWAKICPNGRKGKKITELRELYNPIVLKLRTYTVIWCNWIECQM